MPAAGVKPGPSAQQSRALSITPLPPGRTSGYEETNNAVGVQAILPMVLKCGTEKGFPPFKVLPLPRSGWVPRGSMGP